MNLDLPSTFLDYAETKVPGLDVISGYQCDVIANNANYNGLL